MCLVYSMASLLCQSQNTRQRWIYSETVIAHVPANICGDSFRAKRFPYAMAGAAWLKI